MRTLLALALACACAFPQTIPAPVNLSGVGSINSATVTSVLDGSVAYCADAGASDTYACSLSPAPAAYVTGARYRFKANTANTGASSINFNSLGAKTIVKVAGGITTALADNDIRVGQVVDLVYDGTNMQMQSLLGNAPSGGSGGAALYVDTYSNINAASCSASDWTGFPTDSIYHLTCAGTVAGGARAITARYQGMSVTRPAAASNWTIVSSASGTASKADVAGSVVWTQTTGANATETMIKAVPATPYVTIFTIRPSVYGSSTGGYPACGVAWTNGTTTSSATQSLRFIEWYQTSSEVIVDHATDYAAAGYAADFQKQYVGDFGTLRVRVSDNGTTKTLDITPDGINWQNVFSAARATNFTPTHYGVTCTVAATGAFTTTLVGVD